MGQGNTDPHKLLWPIETVKLSTVLEHQNPLEIKFYDIDEYGLRFIDKCQKSSEMLCGMLNWTPSPTKFPKYTELLVWWS